MKEYLALLGTTMKDRVTGVTGMVSSVCFDAYGCIQLCLAQTVQPDGKVPDSYWMDEKRLEPAGPRIMDAPAFVAVKAEDVVRDRVIGSADKPSRGV